MSTWLLTRFHVSPKFCWGAISMSHLEMTHAYGISIGRHFFGWLRYDMRRLS